MNYFAISGILTGITSFVLGIFVLSKSKNNKLNKIWAIFCFLVAIWGFGGFEVALTKTRLDGLYWWKITYVGIIFIPVLFYHFVYTFLQLKNKFWLYLFYSYGIFFLIIEWTPWAHFFYGIENISLLFNSLHWVFPPTPLFIFFVLSWYAIVLYAHVKLFQVYKESVGLKKAQIKYIFVGMAIAFFGGGMSFLPCFGIKIYPYLNFASAIFPFIIAYAIIRHRLMDIKMVMRRYSVYAVSLATIIILSFSLGWALNKLFPEFIFWNDTIVLILAITIFPAVKNYFYKVANKYFFSSLYDSREVIAGISDKLRRTLDVNIIFEYIYETINNAFHVKSFGILRYREGKDDYVVQYNKDFNVKWQQEFKSNEELHEIYIKKNKTLILEEARAKHMNNKTKETLDILTRLNVDILTPLNVKDKTVGLLVLGPKESGDMYNDEDLQVLEIIGAQAAIAIENALLFDETRQFGLKLEKEVKKATGDLRKANEKLKKLDEAKSEFISIASHQLRTPLTIIKGYISMILEGNFGELTEGEEDSLEKVYESNERLIQLVENLLNISRIESGRLQFNFEIMQLEVLTHSVFEELESSAKKKGVKLILKVPKKPLPAIKIDQEKIRQVVMNLIDNAIKYTKKGSVTVSVRKVATPESRQAKEGIEFSVSDSGMGITKTDLPNLFKKFSRGTDTSLVHTEGTGLGLFVARQMIEAHKGKVWAESKGEGKGSRFLFVLPIR